MSLGNEHWDNIVTDLLHQKIDLNATANNHSKKNTDGPHKEVIKTFSCIKCDDFDCHDSFHCSDASQVSFKV